jgi:hypothetical protein
MFVKPYTRTSKSEEIFFVSEGFTFVGTLALHLEKH